MRHVTLQTITWTTKWTTYHLLKSLQLSLKIDFNLIVQTWFKTDYYTPCKEVLGGYTGFNLFVRPYVHDSRFCLNDYPNSKFWLSDFNKILGYVSLDEYLGRNKISASYLIEYVHNGRSRYLCISGIPKVNFTVNAFKFGISRIIDIFPSFGKIPIFSYFFVMHFLIILGARSWLFGIWRITWIPFICFEKSVVYASFG